MKNVLMVLWQKSYALTITCIGGLIILFSNSYGQTIPAFFITHQEEQKKLLDSIKIYLEQGQINEAIRLQHVVYQGIGNFSAFYIAGVNQLDTSYTRKISDLNQQIGDKETDIKRLSKQLEGYRADARGEVVSMMNNFLQEQNQKDEQIKSLTSENRVVAYSRDSLQGLIGGYEEFIDTLEGQRRELAVAKAFAEKELKRYTSLAPTVGISIGFNGFTNGELLYTVQVDSTIREEGKRCGFSAIISAVVSLNLSSTDNIVINIPLLEVLKSKESAVGFFNERIALGVGYSRRFFPDAPQIAIGAILNASPYNKLNYDSMKNRKFPFEEGEALPPEKYTNNTAYSFSVSLAVIYDF